MCLTPISAEGVCLTPISIEVVCPTRGLVHESRDSCSGVRFWDSDFGICVSRFGFRDSGFAIRVPGLGFGDSRFGFRNLGFVIRVLSLRIRDSGFVIRVSGYVDVAILVSRAPLIHSQSVFRLDHPRHFERSRVLFSARPCQARVGHTQACVRHVLDTMWVCLTQTRVRGSVPDTPKAGLPALL